ncbi:MAG: helix-turn-helix domain-containing protein [Pseudomonadota bacterium]|nr:helix-turn-helix domain-containing protein [Pseudomonadota bacterium]
MQTWSTADAPRGTRAAWWNALYAERFANVTFSPACAGEFQAELALGTLGPLGIARIRATPSAIERTSAHVERGGSRLISFIYVSQGSATFEHNGNTTDLRRGDFTLCDNAAPHRLHSRADTELVVVRAAPDVLRERIPQPEGWCGLVLSSGSLFASAAAQMTGELSACMEAGLPRRFASVAARNLLDVLATAFGLAFERATTPTPSVAARRIAACRHVEAHLRDPQLSPTQVAAALHVSPRYLRMLFQDGGETLSAYILRRRLEECARLLANPLWSRQTVTDIAFGVGFNSAAHFTRAFRQQFGTTPTAYRRGSLAAAA